MITLPEDPPEETVPPEVEPKDPNIPPASGDDEGTEE